MYKTYGVALVFLIVLLAGCKGNDFNVKYENGNDVLVTPVVKTKPTIATKPKKKVSDFPNEALAVPEVQQRRENGNSGNNETRFISIIINEEIGTCFTRRIEVQGRFEKNLSEDWSLGQSSKWDIKKTSVTVNIKEDTRKCGGALLVFNGTAVIADTSFKVDKDTNSVYFYADIPVYSGVGRIEDVNIAIDSTQIATSSLAGGNTSSGNSTEYASGYDSKSESKFEGVNITINGGIYINSLAVNGIIHAKVSKLLSSYDSNGIRPVDPFVQQAVYDGRG